MLKFKDYKYKRPDFKRLEIELNDLIVKFKNVESLDMAIEYFEEINRIKKSISTMEELVYIRHSIDTLDKYYEDEQNFMDEEIPKFDKVLNTFNEVLVSHKYREELENEYGKQLFRLLEMERDIFSEDIIDDLIEENKLGNEYSKIMASARIEFDGKILNLSELGPYRQSTDREIRKKAEEAAWKFLAENEYAFDEIFDKLVKLRDGMAKKLGYKNFFEIGYKRMSRSDYNSDDVKKFRDQVHSEIVPIVNRLMERQRERLNYESLKHYDENYQFLSGNPNPKGNPDWIVANAKNMYEELSKETGAFFNYMIDSELMDLVTKKGKMGGGYCTFIDDYNSPFIFSNFNGTRGDIEVLTHEAGHAFQKYMSKPHIMEYKFATSEVAEIHSMSMEFLTWPWMEYFFGGDTDKFKYSHLSGFVEFIPYGVAVDEFQHYVYENPEVTPSERKDKWRELEEKYLPFRDYDGIDILERGGYWFKQGHIFEDPFYYIDYTLAQICAFQFFNKYNIDKENAWNDYLRLCEKGGSMSFLELLDIANLENPFVDGVIKKTIKPILKWLDNIDDKKL